ncbi:MAG TPA: hypothetical protein VGB38_05775, partial [bacterium]
EVKERVRVVSIRECEALARSVLEMDSTEDIQRAIHDFNNEANRQQNVPIISSLRANKTP